MVVESRNTSRSYHRALQHSPSSSRGGFLQVFLSIFLFKKKKKKKKTKKERKKYILGGRPLVFASLFYIFFTLCRSFFLFLFSWHWTIFDYFFESISLIYRYSIALPIIKEVVKSFASVGDHIKLTLAQIMQACESMFLFLYREMKCLIISWNLSVFISSPSTLFPQTRSRWRVSFSQI